MDEALAQKLKRLLALATLRSDEEGNEARENESRTAAFLLMKTCRENDVTITFKLKSKETAKPGGIYPKQSYDMPDLMELFQIMQEELRRQRKGQADFASRANVYAEDDAAHAARYAQYWGSPSRDSDDSYKKRDGWKLIVSRFDGSCRHCHRPYIFGNYVYWNKGIGTVHDRCLDAYLKQVGEVRV